MFGKGIFTFHPIFPNPSTDIRDSLSLIEGAAGIILSTIFSLSPSAAARVRTHVSQ